MVVFMKKLLLLFTAFSVFILSCTSTGKTAESDYEKQKEQVLEIHLKTEAELFTESVSGIKLSVISKPGPVTNGSEFSKPFSVKVTGSADEVLTGFPIIVRYPTAKENGIIKFSEASILTDETGTATFTAGKTNFSCDSEISFFPDPKSDNADIIKAAEKIGVKAPWQVRTKLRSNGLIGLVDYNLKGNALADTLSSSLLLKNLMNKGFISIGNFDIPRNIIDNPEAVYKNVHSIVGNSVSFLIYGTIKYVEPVSKNEDVFTCTLKANVTCLDMSSGKILYSTTSQVTAKDNADWKAVNSAREKLASELGQAVNYNL